MGTNFYCKKNNTEIKKKLRDKFEELHNELLESVNFPHHDYKCIIERFLWENKNMNTEIHLGKRSGGWQFLWDYHGGIYFKPTLESIKKFLSQKDMIIYNEYGEQFTLDQFLNEEISHSLYKDENHKDGSEPGASYIQNWHSHFFKNDGLRFSKFEDFS